MKKCIGIDPKAWLAAKTEAEKQALIDTTHITLTPEEQTARETEESKVQQEMAEAELLKYRELRASEYPKIGDQLDAIMKWAVNHADGELKAIADACMSVKAKYPKP
jgi:hypothetical protein